MRVFLSLFFSVFLVACGAGTGVDGDDPDSTIINSNDSGSTNTNNGDDGGVNSNEDSSTSNPFCGNGEVEEGEECDDGAANSDTEPNACRTDCTLPSCGDGVVDENEGCDSSNFNGATCESEGYTAGTVSCSASCELDFSNCTTCGNSLAEGNDPTWPGYEVCDGTDLRGLSCTDFGLPAGLLACSATCDWNTTGCVGTASCGNGTVEAWETCDDGNTTPCDGCSATCQVEECGNGLVECSETCDDANSSNEDACLNSCVLNTCGDGFINLGVETCDDGNSVTTDACPDGPAGTCQTATCGDGFINLGVETCDDGNGNNDDACPDGVGGTCLVASCGDGFVQTGVENCDPGLDPLCNGDCIGSCGDGVWNMQYEVCDPSDPGINQDACHPDCETYCGDGVIQSQWGEVCDVAMPGHPPNCIFPSCTLGYCGDGICSTSIGEEYENCQSDCTCEDTHGPGYIGCGIVCWQIFDPTDSVTCCSDNYPVYQNHPSYGWGTAPFHCGDCSTSCVGTQECVNGQCV